MRDTHVLCAACILALVAITAVFIGYATDTLPHATYRVVTTSSPTHVTSTGTMEKEKDCTCCADRMARFREYIEKARQQRLAAENMEKRSPE